MILLETEKIWTGDGFGSTPVTLKQIKIERLPKIVNPKTVGVAMYERISKNGKFDGYEVFQIRVSFKGDKLPNGSQVEDDRERYPSSASFGKYAWHCLKRERAEEVFNQQLFLIKSKLSGETIPETIQPLPEEKEKEELIPQQETPKTSKTIILPEGEFSTIQFGQVNNMPVPGKGYLTLRALVEIGMVVESSRRKIGIGQGRATIFYKKA
jgi:hypothetical protein